jgi:hypothetical protein
MAGYILDAKAHIKDQMVAAVDVFRQRRSLGSIGAGIDNWGGAQKPAGYPASTLVPARADDPAVRSRDPVRQGTEQLAQQALAKPGTDPAARASAARADAEFDPALWSEVGQHLGRAMHAFEDFWSHSNWLALALELRRAREGGSEQARTSDGRLETGSFDALPNKVHAAGHKLKAMADALEGDFDLLLRVYGAQGEDRSVEGPRPRGDAIASMAPLTQLRNRTRGGLSGLLDVMGAAGALKGLADGRGRSRDEVIRAYLGNRTFLGLLRRKGEELIAEGSKGGDPHSHAQIAKDQPEPGRDYGTASRLATEANRLVFAPLRGVMSDRDPDQARARIQSQLGMVDELMRAPSTDHPLWGIVESASATGP